MAFEPIDSKDILDSFNNLKLMVDDSDEPPYYMQIKMKYPAPKKKMTEHVAYKSIVLEEMVLNHIHEKCQIFVQVMKTPVQTADLVTIVEDSNGVLIFLSLCNYKLSVTPEVALPLGTILCIKNPLLNTFANEYDVIKVDNPQMVVEILPK